MSFSDLPTPRVPLWERLPEIHRIRDAEQHPAYPLRAFLGAMEEVLGAVHENIEALYDDLFIDTCDPWVIPYLADLLGTSHLRGPTATLRADVADTVALRRRKGTREAIERLAANLTGWPCRAVELRERAAWAQHLNHLRPHMGGTLPVRDPAALALVDTPFDTGARTPDVRPPAGGALRVNLPNLAIFLWRLSPQRIAATRPLAVGVGEEATPSPGEATFCVRLDVEPLDRPVRLFNTWRRPDATAGVTGAGIDEAGAAAVGRRDATGLTEVDAVPGPIPSPRLTSGHPAGAPAAYVQVDRYAADVVPPTGLELGETGLQLYLPDDPELDAAAWSFRGDTLCAWEAGLHRPAGVHEIVVDPALGRVLIGVATAAERDALVADTGGTLQSRVLAGFTTAAVGPVGAHPISRPPAPDVLSGRPVELRRVDGLAGDALQDALAGLDTAAGPVVIEIADSLVHDVDPGAIPGAQVEGGLATLRLAHSLVIRGATGQRPAVRLGAPLAVRPVDPEAPETAELTLRLEGVFVTRGAGFAADAPLVARAAVARLELIGATLDPGGHRLRDGSRAPLVPSMHLADGYGFDDGTIFGPTPDVLLQRSVTGALRLHTRHRLVLEDSIVDAGLEPGDPPAGRFAVTGAEVAHDDPAHDPAAAWGPPVDVRGAHLLGRVRVETLRGSGGLFVGRTEAWNDQTGCLTRSWLSGDADRVPANHACLRGPAAPLAFTSTRHGDAAYGQLAPSCDPRIRTRGPGDDQMGAFGFLQETHRRANLDVRLREFMPVGIRPLVHLVT